MRSVLAACDVFRGLDDAVLTDVARLSSVRSFEPGRHPFLLGQPADEIFVVASGRIDLSVPISILGTMREVGVESRGEGAALAASAYFRPHRYRLTAHAVTQVELVAIPREGLSQLLAARPVAERRFLENVAERAVRDLLCAQAMWIRELQRSLGADLASRAAPAAPADPVSAA